MEVLKSVVIAGFVLIFSDLVCKNSKVLLHISLLPSNHDG